MSTAPTYTLGPLEPATRHGVAFRLRLPAPPQPTHCLILLHGVGGNETNLLNLAQGVDPHTLVVLAQGPLTLGPQQFAWFRVSFTASGPSIVAAEAERSRLLLIDFVRQLQATYGVAPSHTVIAGFSQGGILSASVSLTAPERVAGFGLLSGRILPEITPHLADAPSLGRLQAFVGHGVHDSKLPLAWAQRSTQWLKELGVRHELHTYPIDHEISSAMHTDFIAWVHMLQTSRATSTPHEHP